MLIMSLIVLHKHQVFILIPEIYHFKLIIDMIFRGWRTIGDVLQICWQVSGDFYMESQSTFIVFLTIDRFYLSHTILIIKIQVIIIRNIWISYLEDAILARNLYYIRKVEICFVSIRGEICIIPYSVFLNIGMKNILLEMRLERSS